MKWFKREDINGGGACPTYLYRWELFRWGNVAIYLHHFVGDDWSRDFHDHPKRFVSFGLKGRYIEHTPAIPKDGGHPGAEEFSRSYKEELFKAPWIRSFPSSHRHRIVLDGDPTAERPDCWTLVFVGDREREWGFWRNNYFIPWREYLGSKALVEMADCP